jgi:hypothetical protein
MKYKQILFLAVLFIATISNAQQNKIYSNRNEATKSNDAVTIEYIVDVTGVDTKQICLNIENTISKKEGVISFKTVGFPSKYFILKATKPILEADLKSWLLENNVKLTFFGGVLSLEELYVNKKNNFSTHKLLTIIPFRL